MENPNPQQPQVKGFELRIVCNPKTGQVTVAGPMEMKADCIKALTVAIQIIVDYNPVLVALGNGHS